ncbi:acyl-CoA N-acyltransferase [Nemania diffusa]|nr:acyl-CoA N-acyltransferase [Nemania diffusa]
MSDMDFMTTAIGSAFRSERLIYRAIEDNEADKTFLFTQLQSDPVTSALGDPSIHRPRNQKTSDQAVENSKSALLAVMICLPGDSSKKADPIGYVTVKEILPYQRRGLLSIQIAATYQNKGYGFEAVNWAMDWSFRWGGFHSLALGASLYNERAVAVYKKAGFRQEGISKEVVYRNRKWWDTVQMAILEHEWEALRGINDLKDLP